MKMTPFQFTVQSSTLTSVAGTAATNLLSKTAHGRVTGEPVIVTFASGFGGLTSGNRYYVIKNDADTFKLATTRENALAGTEIDITSDGTGMTVAYATLLRSGLVNVASALLSPQTDAQGGAGNSFTAYFGTLSALTKLPDPRTPIAVSAPAVTLPAGYDFTNCYVLAASGDGVDVLGFLAL